MKKTIKQIEEEYKIKINANKKMLLAAYLRKIGFKNLAKLFKKI